MRNVFFILLSTVYATLCSAQLDLRNADAVYILDCDSTVYDTIGNSKTVEHEVIKLLTDGGIQHFGTQYLYYDTSTTKLMVLDVKVISPEGDTLNVPDSLIRDISSPGDASANIYWPEERCKVITFPNLKKGSIISYKYERDYRELVFPGLYQGENWVQGRYPKLHAECTITGPKKKRLKFFVANDIGVKFSKNESRDNITYHFWADSIQEIIPEPGMVPRGDITCRLIVTTARSWEEYSRLNYELTEPMLKTDNAIKNMVSTLIKGKSDDLEKMRVIYYYVAQNIRYLGLSAGGVKEFMPHPVIITFKNKAGVCKDKAALLTAMLGEAGLKSWLVLTNPGQKICKEVPCDQFNHEISACKIGDKIYWLDPTDENCRNFLPGYEEDKGVLILSKEGDKLRFTPVVSPEENMVKINALSKLNLTGGLKSGVTIECNGYSDEIVRWIMRRRTPEQRKQFFERLIHSISPAAELDTFIISPEDIANLEEPITIKLNYQIENYGVSSDSLLVFQSPLSTNKFEFIPEYFLKNAKLKQRKTPLDLESTIGLKENEIIKIPEGYRLLMAPQLTSLKFSKISYKSGYYKKNNEIRYEKELFINTPRIYPEEYENLRAILNRSGKSSRERIMLVKERKKYSEAGAVILQDRWNININPDFSSTKARWLRVKILNDRGRHKFSNIKTRYNSNFESVIVDSAWTETKNSERIDVPFNGINVIEPPELADASIYSNVKEKVVSFAGCDSGSIINLFLKIISKPKGRPEWGEFRLQETEPIKERRITISIPESMGFKYSCEKSPTVTVKDGRKTYSFVVNNMPKIVSEPSMPPLNDIVPILVWSTSPSYKMAAETFSKSFFTAGIPDSIVKRETKSIISNINNKEEKIKKIFIYVAKNIRNIKLPLGTGGYECRNASSVLNNKYGDTRDKAVLLFSMLRAANIRAYPVIVCRGKRLLAPTIPTLSQFNCVYIVIPKGDNYVWLDPMRNNCHYSYSLPCASRSLLIKRDTSIIIETIKPQESEVNTKMRLRIDSLGNLSGEVVALATGYFDYLTRRKAMFDTPIKRKQRLSEFVSNIAQGTELDSFLVSDLLDLSHTVRIDIFFHIENYGQIEKNLILFDLPKIPFPFYRILAPSLKERKYPLDLHSPLTSVLDIELNTPKSYKPVYLPHRYEIKRDIGGCKGKCITEENKIKFNSKIFLKNRRISAEKYSDYKEIYQKSHSPSTSLVILRVD